MVSTALILIFVLFGLYGWLSGILGGISLLRLSSGWTLARYGLRLFAPVWLVTNIFLIMGFTGLAVFFNHGLADIRQAVPISLMVGFAALLIQAVLLLYLFYHRQIYGVKWPNLLFIATTFVVPLSFGAVQIRLLLGQGFWQSAVGMVMMLAIALALLALAMSFAYYLVGLTPHGRVQFLSRMLNIGFCVVTAIFLQLLVSSQVPHLAKPVFMIFVIMVALVVVLQAGLWFSARDRYMWWYLSLITAATPVLLMLANRPFLIFPNVYINSSYAANSYGPAAVVGFAIFFPVILIGFGLLTWMLLHPKYDD